MSSKNTNGKASVSMAKDQLSSIVIRPDGTQAEELNQLADAEVVKPEVHHLPAVMELPPVEDRILKVNQLFSLVEKHEALQETRRKLKNFKLSTDGNRDNLRITDSRGNEFQTTNSAVIADVLQTLFFSIDQKILEVESQIRF